MNSEGNDTVLETTREDISLKTGTRLSKWYSCNEECLSGTKFINAAFGSLTFIITIALIIQIYYGDYQVVPHGSVATDSLECSKIGTQILKQGGNAVDAAIASAFCLSVVTPHLTGLDAGGQMMIYSHKTRMLPEIVDFSASNVASNNLPTLVLGLAYIHKLYGSLGWKNLVEPSVDLAKNGYVVTKMLAQAVNRANASDLYGRLEPGQLLRHANLSNTLLTIGNITENELYSYIDSTKQPIKSQAIKSSFYNYDVFVPSADSIGPILLVNLREIEEYNFTDLNVASTKKIIETTLKIYQEFNVGSKFHQGTASNVAVMDLEDNYVSLVTGMYSLFGSGELTTHGYVLDTKHPDKPCSRIPIILTDNKFICGKRMALAANGLAQASQLISNTLITNQNATDAVEAPRFYVLDNVTVAVEAFHTPKFPIDILQYLKDIHKEPILMPEPYYSSNIVEKYKDDLSSHSDSRGGGIASRF